MNQSDKEQFSALLDAVAEMLDKQKPSPIKVSMYFRALARHSLADVRAAIDAHIADPSCGMFYPAPAHILGKIDSRCPQHVGEDEAWAIAMSASDEAATVVWTDQIAGAWNACRPVFNTGDKVGARMAFKAAYARLVDEAKRSGQAVDWTISEGFDKDLKALALSQAIEAGRLNYDETPRFLLGYEEKEVLAIPEFVVEYTKQLKEKMQQEEAIDYALLEREELAAKKRAAQELAENFANGEL